MAWVQPAERLRLATLPRVETKWLEDFVSLAETRSFSRSAQLRHVTQPAFSRRIQALEAWVGVDLVDRSAYPTRLTPAGQAFHAQALEVLDSLQAARNMMRAHQPAGQDTIEFAKAVKVAEAVRALKDLDLPDEMTLQELKEAAEAMDSPESSAPSSSPV